MTPIEKLQRVVELEVWPSPLVHDVAPAMARALIALLPALENFAESDAKDFSADQMLLAAFETAKKELEVMP